MATETARAGIEQEGMMGKLLKKSCPKGEITDENKGAFVGFRNHLQFVLASRKFGETQDHSFAEMWLAEYSAAFGGAFDEIVKKDPLFFDGYATLGDIPEEKWAELEEKVAEHKKLSSSAK